MPPAVVMTAVILYHVHRRMASAFHNPIKVISMPGLTNKPITTLHFPHAQIAPVEANSRIVTENFSGVVSLHVVEEKAEWSSVDTV